MKNFKLKSYCKINLTLKVLKKLRNGNHSIGSLITFCNLYDVINISSIKSTKDKISFFGKFSYGINSKKNTITQVIYLLRKKKLLKNKCFKIDLKKNIPHGSGLGGGSSNAATLLNYFNLKMKLGLSKNKLQKIAGKIGFDVPISLEKKNTFLTGKKDEILRIKKRFGLNLLIVYPNIICSTKKIYKENKKIGLSRDKIDFKTKNGKKFIDYLKNEHNDLESAAVKIYPIIKKLINFIKLQKGCHLSRITGSGSSCIGIFSNMRNAIYAQKLIKLKYPKYWSAVSKTI